MTLVFHERNPARAPRSGRGSTHATCEFAAILDADLEYQASDLAPVVAPLLSGEASVVFGTRAWASHTAYSFWYVMGNKAVTWPRTSSTTASSRT